MNSEKHGGIDRVNERYNLYQLLFVVLSKSWSNNIKRGCPFAVVSHLKQYFYTQK